MARNTQLHGVAAAPFFAKVFGKRNPEPWHCVQSCMASASVSERVHTILVSSPTDSRMYSTASPPSVSNNISEIIALSHDKPLMSHARYYPNENAGLVPV